MQFSDWLDARLRERGWTSADLSRAGVDEDHPRGFDPGLISRWRKPLPTGVVPTAPTLRRLAKAMDLPEYQVFKAAREALHARDALALGMDEGEDAEAEANVSPIQEYIARRAAKLQALADAVNGVPNPFVDTILRKLGRVFDFAEDDLDEAIGQIITFREHVPQSVGGADAQNTTTGEHPNTTDETVVKPASLGPHRPIKPLTRRMATKVA